MSTAFSKALKARSSGFYPLALFAALSLWRTLDGDNWDLRATIYYLMVQAMLLGRVVLPLLEAAAIAFWRMLREWATAPDYMKLVLAEIAEKASTQQINTFAFVYSHRHHKLAARHPQG
ncbi:MAG TPA: hypothetical protein VFO38_05895 [Candidatus Saccharimonadales bacterium]|nr:hypothetical protein [Candidatus Saccharimonadales bacterium]